MTWAKLDDRYDDTRKVKRAWRAHPRAVGLHAMAITYCARHETNGRLHVEWIAEKLPTVRERKAVLDALVSAGLFDPAPDGDYFVHDYLDYNPSAEQLQERRRLDAARKRKGGRADSPRTPDGGGSDSASPVPSRPEVDPTTPP